METIFGLSVFVVALGLFLAIQHEPFTPPSLED